MNTITLYYTPKLLALNHSFTMKIITDINKHASLSPKAIAIGSFD